MRFCVAVVASLLSLVFSHPNLPPRSIGDSCTTPDGEGTCQSTSDCKGWSIPGPLPGYCPNDPDDIQCCVQETCSPPGQTGICQNTNKPCEGGDYNSDNFCPGDESIQCCPNAPAVERKEPPTTSPTQSAPAPVDACAQPKRDTCTFYPDCLESKYECGSDGYPLGYGLKYCHAFTAAKDRLDSKGKQWVSDTMLCLQTALVPYATTETTTCSALKSTAFASHPDCYVNSGVCTLGPADWLVIVETVDPKDLFGGTDNLKAVLKTLGDCTEFYLWLIEQGFITILHQVEDEAKDIWHKATDWL